MLHVQSTLNFSVVYRYLFIHPGGAGAILRNAGTDASLHFDFHGKVRWRVNVVVTRAPEHFLTDCFKMPLSTLVFTEKVGPISNWSAAYQQQ